MELRGPRSLKTIPLLMVAMAILWIANFLTQDVHSALSWVTLALSMTVIAGFACLLLRNGRGPNV